MSPLEGDMGLLCVIPYNYVWLQLSKKKFGENVKEKLENKNSE